jgi:hypothetical protein
MSWEVDSLNSRIEHAWCAMQAWSPLVRHAIYLTPAFLIIGIKPTDYRPQGSYWIGDFDRSVKLDHFRQAAFATFEKMKGPR